MIEGAITPELVTAAAAKAGVSIRPGIFYEPEASAACPLAALYLAGHPEAIGDDLEIRQSFQLAILLGMDEARVAGFINGFDKLHELSGPPLFAFRQEYRHGYREGRACRVALLPAGEVTS